MNQQSNFTYSMATLGPDRLIRMRLSELQALDLQHSASMEDASVLQDYPHARRAGVTEWVGQIGTLPVSIGWDWCEMADGAVLHLEVVSPRANVRLIDERGYDLESAAEQLAFSKFIQNYSWQARVRDALDQDGRASFSSSPVPPSLRYH